MKDVFWEEPVADCIAICVCRCARFTVLTGGLTCVLTVHKWLG